MTLPDWLKVWPQYLLPQHSLSALVHYITRVRQPTIKHLLIDTFIRHYDVNIDEAATPSIAEFEHFNAFFTRALRAGARPLPVDEALCVSPVDGAISEIGPIRDDQLVQAKARRYSVAALLGGDGAAAASYHDGVFATLYLSPRDYHRIHMPCAGTLTEMVYVPGRLFAVNPATARQVDGLFARNERVICHFDSAHGRLTLVMVGAIFVGGIETIWAGDVTPAARRTLRRWNYAATPRRFERGQEFARFNMGSTVVMLAQQGRLQWDKERKAGDMIRQGGVLGRFAQ